MPTKGLKHKVGLEHHGIKNAKEIFWNLTTPALYEHISRNGEGHLSHLGPVVVATGQHTGRAPNDKFIVKEPTSQDDIWWGKVNKPFGVEQFDALHGRILAYLQIKIYMFKIAVLGQTRRNNFTSASLQKRPGIIYSQETCLSKSKTSTNWLTMFQHLRYYMFPAFELYLRLMVQTQKSSL